MTVERHLGIQCCLHEELCDTTRWSCQLCSVQKIWFICCRRAPGRHLGQMNIFLSYVAMKARPKGVDELQGLLE